MESQKCDYVEKNIIRRATSSDDIFSEYNTGYKKKIDDKTPETREILPNENNVWVDAAQGVEARERRPLEYPELKPGFRQENCVLMVTVRSRWRMKSQKRDYLEKNAVKRDSSITKTPFQNTVPDM